MPGCARAARSAAVALLKPVLPWLWSRQSSTRPEARQRTQRHDENRPPLWQRSLRLLRRALVAGLVIGGLIAASIGGRYFAYHSPRLALREIRITGTRHLAQATILSRAAVALGTNLLHRRQRRHRRSLDQRALA